MRPPMGNNIWVGGTLEMRATKYVESRLGAIFLQSFCGFVPLRGWRKHFLPDDGDDSELICRLEHKWLKTKPIIPYALAVSHKESNQWNTCGGFQHRVWQRALCHNQQINTKWWNPLRKNCVAFWKHVLVNKLGNLIISFRFLFYRPI